MANYYGAARSNYFAVKDETAFRASLPMHLTVVTNKPEPGEPQRFALLSDEPDGGGWPASVYDEDTDDYVDIDVAVFVSEHLADGEVAVFMEAGAEKLRYIVGHAVAINGAGETRTVNLNDIYELARELGPNVTEAEG
jgi:hypothetical protein